MEQDELLEKLKRENKTLRQEIKKLCKERLELVKYYENLINTLEEIQLSHLRKMSDLKNESDELLISRKESVSGVDASPKNAAEHDSPGGVFAVFSRK
jgi:DNA anti-recombination protein RmuC